MRMLFLSNYYTHHQAPLCENLDRLTGHRFSFVATLPFSREREKMGWVQEKNVPFVSEYDQLDPEMLAKQLNSCETVILGDAPLETVYARLKKNKVVLKYSERVFKSAYQPLKWLPRLYRYWVRYGRHKSLYLLSAGAYTTVDYVMHGTFIGKSYKWGYFPETRKYSLPELEAGKNPGRILWCGRFLDWKHPDAAIETALRLKAEGYSFELEMIGSGELEDALKRRVEDCGLADCVHFTGAVSSAEVRAHMEKAGIFLFTSDFREGWGAVLNEAMNSGCAVVASHAIGAVPYLLKHRENGWIYPNGDMDALYAGVKHLLDDPDAQRSMGRKAYHTIADLWNAGVAAERLLRLAQEIQDHGECTLYADGPCSKAPVIRNNWFRG